LLRLILAEAEIERVPESIAGHPAVVKNAKKRGKRPGSTLLDANLHHSAMRKLTRWERRGRPDLVHAFLLLALDSIANQRGEMEVLVHTRNDEVIRVSQETRLPKGYNRFCGLMESLFQNRAVPDRESPLLEIEKMELPELLKNYESAGITVLRPERQIKNLNEYMRDTGVREHTFVIGGFAVGDFQTDFSHVCHTEISISALLLKVWTVTSEVIVNYEIISDLH